MEVTRQQIGSFIKDGETVAPAPSLAHP